MNKVFDYIRSLNPVQERKTVLSVLSQLQEELNEYTLPAAEEVLESFAGVPFQSAYHNAISAELTRKVNFQKGAAFTLLVQSLRTLSDNIPFLESEVKKAFGMQFTSEGLSFRRFNLLRYVESALFYTRYFRKLILRLVAEEAASKGSATPESWSKAEAAWINDNLRNFIGLYNAISQPEAALKSTLQHVSEAEINEETYGQAMTAFGQRGTDPMQLGLFSPTTTWIFTLGKAIVEYQAKRYNNAKEERTALQLRLQEMRELREGGVANPKLQKLIQHTEHRVEQLDYQIAKIEDANRYE